MGTLTTDAANLVVYVNVCKKLAVLDETAPMAGQAASLN